MKKMSLEDNNDTVSDTLEDMRKNSKKEIVIAGSTDEHYDNWMDLLCKNCDSSLMIIQMNKECNKIKIICSKCGGIAEIKIEKVVVNEENEN
jgi:hypothetical protein